LNRSFPVLLALAACAGNSVVDTGPATFGATPLLSVDSDQGLAHVEVRSDPQPPEVGVSAFQYVVTDVDGAPIEGLDVSVTPWMPQMGMGASVQPTVSDRGGGVYQVDDVDLVMSGTWELQTTFAGPVVDTVAPSLEVP
jgi:hypothetical protein